MNENVYYTPPVLVSTPRFIITHNEQPLRLTFSKSPPPFSYSPQMSARSPIKISPVIPQCNAPNLKEIKE